MSNINKGLRFARFVQKNPFPHNAQILAKTKQSNAHSQRYIKSTITTSTHALPQQLYRGLIRALVSLYRVIRDYDIRPC